MNYLKLISVSTILLVSAAGQLSAAPTYGFTGVSGTSAIATAVGEAQFSVELFDLSPQQQVRFVFSNVGPQQSSITHIYWGDSGALLTPDSIENNANVAFAWGANPKNMKNTSWDSTLASGALSPSPQNGVNPGESVGFIFDIAPGSTFEDITSAISNNTLRFGLHGQSFTDGSSEWFENGNPPVVPAPAALLLATLGTSLVGLIRRR